MALSFSSSIGGLMLYNGFYRKLTSGTCTIGLYQGERPDVNTIQSNWSKYNTTGSETLAVLSVPLLYNAANTTIYAGGLPAANQVVPYQNGTATWGIIMYRQNVRTGAPWSSAGVMPAAYSLFMVVDVTSTTGNGVIRLENTALTTDTKITTIDMSLGFTNG